VVEWVALLETPLCEDAKRKPENGVLFDVTEKYISTTVSHISRFKCVVEIAPIPM
jgi:hypothetical protein